MKKITKSNTIKVSWNVSVNAPITSVFCESLWWFSYNLKPIFRTTQAAIKIKLTSITLKSDSKIIIPSHLSKSMKRTVLF
jgi:hypothetical protein